MILIVTSIIASIIFKNHYIGLISIFIIGYLLKDKVLLKNKQNKIINFIHKYIKTIYILSKFIILFTSAIGLIHQNSISDVLGYTVLIILIGLINGYTIKYIPIIRKIM